MNNKIIFNLYILFLVIGSLLIVNDFAYAGAVENQVDKGAHVKNDFNNAKVDLMRVGEPTGIKYPNALRQKLAIALQTKGPEYSARTEHLSPQGQPIYTNRLILESSPYLIQHAHNPVNWYSWGEEAFAEAEQQDKPVFLSIGYSTCHWCHVMESESFDNPAIAAILNEYFIAIKVDREQHPDVDNTYMTGVMMLTGSGGWPLSSFITPQGNTFYGGTYFRPDDFSRLLLGISNAWSNNREKLVEQSLQVAGAVQKSMATSKKAAEVGRKTLESTYKRLEEQSDPFNGGFGVAPKFPSESSLLFLLNRAQSSKDEAALEIALKSLDGMALGGIYDQVGGGFHRYAVDDGWQIPHFEKMLYNQALLIRAYVRAYELTQKEKYRRVAEQTLDYVLREMTDNNGGFYSATDADSEGEEGLFFIWSITDLEDVLEPKEAELAISLFGLTEQGNFEGLNILHFDQSVEAYANEHLIDTKSLYQQVDLIREKLRLERSTRIAPIRDDKIILSWNSMMITTFSQAAYVLDRPDYQVVAEKAANFLWQNSLLDGGRLARIYYRGAPSIEATQEDYAYFAESLLKLYDTTNNALWLQRAQELSEKMTSLFWDEKDGGFYMNTQSSTPMMGRAKSSMDNSIPSGNSVALSVLEKLAYRGDDIRYRQNALRLINAFSSELVRIPEAFAFMMTSINNLENGETGMIRHAAKGHVRVALSPMVVSDSDNKGQLSLSLSIDENWHINADKPLQDYLIPTEISLGDGAGWTLDKVQFPVAEKQKLGFSEQTLALYQGQQTLELTLVETAKPKNSKWLSVYLRLQACDDSVCLAPETLQFNLRRTDRW